jgi:hypothetical protein
MLGELLEIDDHSPAIRTVLKSVLIQARYRSAEATLRSSIGVYDRASAARVVTLLEARVESLMQSIPDAVIDSWVQSAKIRRTDEQVMSAQLAAAEKLASDAWKLKQKLSEDDFSLEVELPLLMKAIRPEYGSIGTFSRTLGRSTWENVREGVGSILRETPLASEFAPLPSVDAVTNAITQAKSYNEGRVLFNDALVKAFSSLLCKAPSLTARNVSNPVGAAHSQTEIEKLLVSLRVAPTGGCGTDRSKYTRGVDLKHAEQLAQLGLWLGFYIDRAAPSGAPTLRSVPFNEIQRLRYRDVLRGEALDQLPILGQEVQGRPLFEHLAELSHKESGDTRNVRAHPLIAQAAEQEAERIQKSIERIAREKDFKELYPELAKSGLAQTALKDGFPALFGMQTRIIERLREQGALENYWKQFSDGYGVPMAVLFPLFIAQMLLPFARFTGTIAETITTKERKGRRDNLLLCDCA